MLSVSLLGDFRIRYDETPITGVDTPRLQSLLAYLILHRDAPQSRAHLAFLFWPDTNEAQARTNLRNLLHHLRRALPSAESYVSADAQTLHWRPDAPVALDVADFSAALARAEQATKSGDAAAAEAALQRAVALYKGDLLPSCYDDWIMPLRESLRQSYLGALERLVCLLEAQGDYEAAIGNAQRLLWHDPVHEAAYRRLIRLHALNDDRAGALRVYHTCVTVLRRELDVEPGVATREVYEQLLGTEAQAPPTAPAATAFSPLVGREREWTQMLKAWRTVAAGGEPHLVLLRGEAGIGKTRLLEEMLQWASRQGVNTASARCYAAEGDLAYAPVTAWLRTQSSVPLEDVWLAEIARLLPEILTQRPHLPRPAALTEAWQRERLFEALSRAVLTADQPLLATIDDLQWCDRDTLEWGHFLMHFNPDARLMVVGAYRPEEIGDGHPLLALLRALRSEGRVTELDLGPLDEASTRTLATLLAGVEVESATARRLYRETEGNPLFVVETVRAGLLLQDPSAVRKSLRASLPGDTGLPPKVRSVLEARLAQLLPAPRELASLAATIGREFSFSLLAKASGRDENTLVRELDELWQRRIVREQGADAYDFSHDKLREVAYRGMSAARRRLMHRNVARALETIHAGELDPVSYQVAVHYERAGLREEAAPYYLRAAQLARGIYANDDAFALLQRGLMLVADVPEADGGRQLAAHLWEGLGDVMELRAEHDDALQAYQSAQARVPEEDGLWQARLHRKSGIAMREQRLYAQALDACRRAEGVLGDPPEADDSAWWAEWIEVQVDRVWAHYWLAQSHEMEDLVQTVEPVVQERAGVASRARFMMASNLMYLRRDRYVVSDELLAMLLEALNASREWGDPKAINECQFELGFLRLWRRELDEAEESLLGALEVSERGGVVWLSTLALTYLTVVRRFRGELDAVKRGALRAQDSAVAAHMPDYVAAAQGNHAWAAWREGDLAEAAARGQAALERWRESPLVYPFRWMALWPLIGVALAGGQEEEAWSHVQALLEPTQQRLPDELDAALQAAVGAREEGRSDAASAALDEAVSLARAMGYL